MKTGEKEQTYYACLRQQVERTVGKEMKLRRHFDMLAENIYTHTRSMISPTTLRRFWGYQESGVNASQHTLDVLSVLVGHRDWDEFKLSIAQQTSEEDGKGSDFMHNMNVVNVESLKCSQQVAVSWKPNRRVTLVHEGADVFRVVVNENSKLRPGDTFRCKMLVEGQPLICTDLLREGHSPMNYIGGKEGGIKFILK